MRKGAVVLTILAAVCFLIGAINSFFGNWALGMKLFALDPETFWRGAAGMLLFAITLLLLDQKKR